MCTGWPCIHCLFTASGVLHIHNCLHSLIDCQPCLKKATEALVEVSGDVLWIGNNALILGGAVYLTSPAQLRLHPSANLTFVSNRGR